MTAATVAGVVTHGIVTNIVKRKLIRNEFDDVSLNKEASDATNKSLDETLNTLEDKINEIRVDQLRYIGGQEDKTSQAIKP